MTNIVIFNMKKRHSGVSSTIFALQPMLESMRNDVAYYGSAIPNSKTHLSLFSLLRLCFLPKKEYLVFHLRRDHEILLGIVLRLISRRKIKLVFTWAGQHHKGRFSGWLTKKCDAIIATSTGATRYAPFTTAMIPHGVNLPHIKDRSLDHPSSVTKIAIIGRVRPDKGTDLFVKALLENIEYSFEAYILGEVIGRRNIEFKRYLERLIEKSAAGAKFKWLPPIAYQEISSFLQTMDIVVACPRYEPFGLTLFEGAAAGCAIIGSRTGAFPDLIGDNERGLLVQCNNIEELASALKKFLSNREYRIESSKKSKDYVMKEFSLDKEAVNISGVYDHLLGKKILFSKHAQ